MISGKYKAWPSVSGDATDHNGRVGGKAVRLGCLSSAPFGVSRRVCESGPPHLLFLAGDVYIARFSPSVLGSGRLPRG